MQSPTRSSTPFHPAASASADTSLAPGRGRAVLAALFCFSAGPVGVAVQRLLVFDFPSPLIIAVQMTLGAAALWGLRPLFPRAMVPPSSVLKGLALGALHPGLFMMVFIAASGRLDAVTAVLLLALMPAAVAVGGRLVLGEALRLPVMIGILVSIAGLAVLVSEREATGESLPLGYALGIAGLVLAAGGVIAGRAMNTATVLPWFLLAPLQVTGAAIVAWIGVLGTGTAVAPAALAAAWLPFLYLAFGMTAASYLAYNFALSRLPTPTLGLLSAGGPGIGALAASAIFATPIGTVAAIGIATILAGTALPPACGLITARRATRTAPDIRTKAETRE